MNDKFDPYAKLGKTDKQEKQPLPSTLDQRLYTSRKSNDPRNAETQKRKTDEASSSELKETQERENAKPQESRNTETQKRKTQNQGIVMYEDTYFKLHDLQNLIRRQSGKKPTLPEILEEALQDLFKKKGI